MKNRQLYGVLFSGASLLALLLFFANSEGNTTALDDHSSETPIVIEKQRGAHVFSVETVVDLEPLQRYNLNWITMVSWGFQDHCDSPEVTHGNGDSLQMREYDDNWVKRIQVARSNGYKVFFKPHLWIQEPAEGQWRSDIFPASDEDWEQWQESYSSFILRYARVAERAEAEMYCIGVEFTRLTLEKTAFWRALIQEVRKVYSGQIVYAANWYKEFENITFWDELDYIGVQAYFPLTKDKNPSLEQISEGWDKHLTSLEAIHEKYDRPIVFTEMGYRSTANSAARPWEWVEYSDNQDNPYSPKTQANCYQAFFDTVWNQDWLAGVHLWQLRSDFSEGDPDYDLDFTPQGKLAEVIIASGFE